MNNSINIVCSSLTSSFCTAYFFPHIMYSLDQTVRGTDSIFALRTTHAWNIYQLWPLCTIVIIKASAVGAV